MKKYLYTLGAILVVLVGMLILLGRKAEAPGQSSNEPSSSYRTKSVGDLTPLDLSYMVDGQIITLEDGKSAQKVSAGRASEIITEVYGEPESGDIGGGQSALMFLVQQGGGTGVFVYVVAAYMENGMQKGSEAFFLGDRITPQSIRIVDGTAEVKYLDRREDEPMADEPTLAVTKYIVLKNGVLKEK